MPASLLLPESVFYREEDGIGKAANSIQIDPNRSSFPQTYPRTARYTAIVLSPLVTEPKYLPRALSPLSAGSGITDTEINYVSRTPAISPLPHPTRPYSQANRSHTTISSTSPCLGRRQPGTQRKAWVSKRRNVKSPSVADSEEKRSLDVPFRVRFRREDKSFFSQLVKTANPRNRQRFQERRFACGVVCANGISALGGRRNSL